MSSDKYTYAVARIRALELTLFSASTIEQLIACKDYRSCIQFLEEKGWGTSDAGQTADAMLTREEEKIWELMGELKIDHKTFEILFIPNEFHNLKAAVKKVATSAEDRNVYISGMSISPEDMEGIIREKRFEDLPAEMRKPAQEALEGMLHNGDGQLCDCIIDRATLEAIRSAGMKAEHPLIKQYAETMITVADIKIAVRSLNTGKSLEFMKDSMVDCETLNTDMLSQAALEGRERLYDYLTEKGCGEAVEALKDSPSAFERWCDNRIIETIRPQKYNPFSAGPLIAFVLARENEIKTVRIILTCKQNGITDESIRGRVREMYV
jgi:V/A-type H+-transporting ATPase subunit C